MKPWWKQRTFWSAAVAALAAAPVLVDQVAPLLTPDQAVKLAALASVAAALAGVFSRIAGVNAAEEVREDLSPTYVIPIEPGQ